MPDNIWRGALQQLVVSILGMHVVTSAPGKVSQKINYLLGIIFHNKKR